MLTRLLELAKQIQRVFPTQEGQGTFILPLFMCNFNFVIMNRYRICMGRRNGVGSTSTPHHNSSLSHSCLSPASLGTEKRCVLQSRNCRRFPRSNHSSYLVWYFLFGFVWFCFSSSRGLMLPDRSTFDYIVHHSIQERYRQKNIKFPPVCIKSTISYLICYIPYFISYRVSLSSNALLGLFDVRVTLGSRLSSNLVDFHV